MAYTTSTYVEEEIRATDSFSTATNPTLATVERWIDESDSYINDLAGRSFESTSYNAELNYDGVSSRIMLENSPIITVDNFLYYTDTLGSASYLTSSVLKTEDTHFTVYEDKGYLDILFEQFQPTLGKKRFNITYTAGYGTIPTSIQMLSTKMTAQRVLNSLLSNNVDQTNTGGSVSVGSISIVEPADVGLGTYKQLGIDIKDLQNVVAGEFNVHRYND